VTSIDSGSIVDLDQIPTGPERPLAHYFAHERGRPTLPGDRALCGVRAETEGGGPSPGEPVPEAWRVCQICAVVYARRSGRRGGPR
jgi:hypothetical protein